MVAEKGGLDEGRLSLNHRHGCEEPENLDLGNRVSPEKGWYSSAIGESLGILTCSCRNFQKF